MVGESNTGIRGSEINAAGNHVPGKKATILLDKIGLLKQEGKLSSELISSKRCKLSMLTLKQFFEASSLEISFRISFDALKYALLCEKQFPHQCFW